MVVKSSTTSKAKKPPVKVDDREDGYLDFGIAVSSRPATGLIFTTDAADLFDAYLFGLPRKRTQHYTCSACRKFIDGYGGLVTIGQDGVTHPVIWPRPEDVPEFFRESTTAIRALVMNSKVTGVFLSPLRVLGTPITGPWRHLHTFNVVPFMATRFRTAGQAMAEKLEEYGMLQRALAEFPIETVEQAERILKSETLYRSEKCLGVATWLLGLHRSLATVKNKNRRSNLVWRDIASAPIGFAHVRSTMIGTLLDDIAAGLSFEEVSKRFADKMHPLQYQRPSAPPSAGNIARAEAVVAELQAAGALRRRFARLSDIKALWTPAPPDQPKGGVFGHLIEKKPKGGIELPAVTMTWEKFQRTVLPDASEISFLVPGVGGFTALLTAADPLAPPILQWDSLEERNPVSWYFYNGGSTARTWGLETGRYVHVTAICLKPSMWGSRPLTHHGEGVFLLLHGARDSRGAGLALFPETLKSEFHEIRRTIESFSNNGVLEGRAEAEACGFGLMKGEGSEWSAFLRVTDRTGGVANYKLDRWD